MPPLPPPATAPAPARAWLRVLLFLAAFSLSLALYRSPLGAPLERALIERVTVPAAALLLQQIDPQAGVRAEGTRLVAAGGGLNIRNGCEGSDVALLLAAGLLVAPMPWRWRLAGVLLAMPLLLALNLGRVLLLFYAFRLAPGWFAVLHGLVAPLALVALAGAGFVAWLRLVPWLAGGLAARAWRAPR